MKGFVTLLLGVIFVTLIAGSTESVAADHSLEGQGIFKDENSINLVSTKDSKYQIHLQVVVRNAQGQLVSVSESIDAKYIPHKITDYILDEEFGKKEIVITNKMKYEKIQDIGTFDVQKYRFRTSYHDILSTWSIEFTADFPEHGMKNLPVFEVYTPHVYLTEDDTFTLHWTVLREIN